MTRPVLFIHKIKGLAALTVLCAPILAACGGGSGGSSAPTVPPVTVTPPFFNDGSTTPETNVVEPGLPIADSKTSSDGSIAYGNNTYITLYKNSFSTSKDGLNWSAPIPGIDTRFSKVTWYKSRFVAVGEKGMVASSADGQSWQLAKAQTDQNLLQLGEANGKLMAIGRVVSGGTDARSTVLSSVDGVSWTAGTANMPLREWTAGATSMVALPDSGSENAASILASTDGLEWKTATLPSMNEAPPQASLRLITRLGWGNGQFLALVEFRSPLAAVLAYSIWRSTDGLTWTKQYDGTGGDNQSRLNAVVYSGDQFVAVGPPGLILTSPNGITWTKHASGTTQPLYSVTRARGLYLAGGGAGALVISQNAGTWRKVETGVTNGLFELRHSGTAYYALMSGTAPFTQPNYTGGYGQNSQRTTANLASRDGRSWLEGPAATGTAPDF